jgi:hypothetical protein
MIVGRVDQAAGGRVCERRLAAGVAGRARLPSCRVVVSFSIPARRFPCSWESSLIGPAGRRPGYVYWTEPSMASPLLSGFTRAFDFHLPAKIDLSMSVSRTLLQ